MKTIRSSVFETNSSSCHAVTITGENTQKAFLTGELYCLYNFDGICDDAGTLEFLVPDYCYLTKDQLRERLQDEMSKFKDLSDFKSQLYKEQTWREDYSSEYDDLCISFFFKHYCVDFVDLIEMDLLNSDCFDGIVDFVFGRKLWHIKYNSSESCPLVSKSISDTRSDIKGSAITIYKEIHC